MTPVKLCELLTEIGNAYKTPGASCQNAIDWILSEHAEQRQRLQELEEWQAIVLGTGTDQEAVIRMAAMEYTKVAIQAWKEVNEEQRQEIARLREDLDCAERALILLRAERIKEHP